MLSKLRSWSRSHTKAQTAPPEDKVSTAPGLLDFDRLEVRHRQTNPSYAADCKRMGGLQKVRCQGASSTASMPTRLVAVWSSSEVAQVNKTSSERQNLWSESQRTLDQRLNTLEGALVECAKQMLLLPAAMRTSLVFVLPEHHFSARGLRVCVPMSETEKQQVEAHIVGLSKKFPHILLVCPFFWEKEPTRPSGTAHQFKYSAQTLERTEPKTQDPDRIKQLDDHIDTMLLEHAWRFGHLEVLRVLQGLHDMRGRIAPLHEVDTELKAGKRPKTVRNAVWILQDGKRLHKYDKTRDFFETQSRRPPEAVFVPGIRPSYVEVGPASIHIEICADHGMQVAKKSNKRADLHLVVSDICVTTEASAAMHNNGYLIHASTDLYQTGVYTSRQFPRVAEGNTPRRIAAHLWPGVGSLQIFALPELGR